MMISILWLLIRRLPRIFMMLLLFISVFLLGFLLLGCTNNNKSYSSIYLLEYSLNHTSSMYPLIEEAYNSKSATKVGDMVIKVGYMGVCVDFSASLNCSSDLGDFKGISGVVLYDSNSNSTAATLNLIEIAHTISNKAIQPYVLMATLVLVLCWFLIILYTSLKFLPGQHIAQKLSIILAPATCTLWAFGSMWAEVASRASVDIIEPSSMNIVTGSVGMRAKAMTWTSFSFIMATTLGCLLIYWKESRERGKSEKERDTI